MTKQELWKLIEQYRTSGGREEHWRNRDILDHAIDVALDDSLIASQAKRLALELECLLNDTQDMAKVSKWWGSAMEALQLYRDACSVAYSDGEQQRSRLWRCTETPDCRAMGRRQVGCAAVETADRDARGMFVARLEDMQKNGDTWLTVQAVLALRDDCDMLAARERA